MGLFIQIIRRKIKKLHENKIKHGNSYYKTIHKLPVYNWFKIGKGELNYLYKDESNKYIPSFFYGVIQNMMYEFEVLDLTIPRKKAQIAILKSRAARTGNKTVEFNAKILEKEIENEVNKLKESDSFNLDGFLDYIELTFNNLGSLNPYKISTARAFSLFQKAKKRNVKVYENN